MILEYHADDYGISLEQCERILDCHREGRLNGFSIMPNSDILEEAMALAAPYEDRIAYTIHLNLRDGRSNAPKEKIPHLTDSSGRYDISFGRLVIGSYLPGLRKTLRKELATEFSAQIKRLAPYFKDGRLRFDGHGHYHMVPVVFDALADVIREEDLDVSFIRVPRENVGLYLRHRKEIRDFKAINFVKVAILNTFSKRNIRKYPGIFGKAKPFDFMGVMLSGHMSYENVMPVYDEAIELAQKAGHDLEILFHPGSVLEEEALNKLNSEGKWFFDDPWRAKEADALKRLPVRKV
ncbi:MAG: ChbG/HpnK family deacetylase [Lachnospiraceae bacterium]|nr:ChbG/HpnK family deacetylase [Lachnospiraceae bacterium]